MPGDRASRAHGINASGQVIGEISGTGLYNGRTRAFLLAAVKKATSAPTSMILRSARTVASADLSGAWSLRRCGLGWREVGALEDFGGHRPPAEHGA